MLAEVSNRMTFDATRELRFALRRLQDLAELQQSPLARTTMVRERALRCHPDESFAEGRALRDLLLETIVQLDRTLAASTDQEDPAETKKLRLVLRALARGESIATAARSLGLPPSSHSSRLLYRVHHMLVRTFLQRAGQMTPSAHVTAPEVALIGAERGRAAVMLAG